MSWSGGGGNQVIVYMCLVDIYICIVFIVQVYFWSVGGIGVVGLFLQNIGGGQQLWVMVDGGDRFMCGVEGLYQFNNFFVQVQIFWCLVVGDYQCIVVFGFYCGEVSVQCEVMVWFFVISLGVVKVMDCGYDIVVSGFIWVDGIDLVFNYLQCLKRNYCFVIFGKVWVLYMVEIVQIRMNMVRCLCI